MYKNLGKKIIFIKLTCLTGIRGRDRQLVHLHAKHEPKGETFFSR